MTTDRLDVRVGQSERDAVIVQLAEHHAAGRLTRAEHEQRVSAALEARTAGQLSELLADLPALAAAVPDVSSKAITLWRTTGLFPWVAFSAFFVLLWALTGAGYFWPVWPTLGWGLGVAITGVLAHRLPAVYLERQRQRRC